MRTGAVVVALIAASGCSSPKPTTPSPIFEATAVSERSTCERAVGSFDDADELMRQVLATYRGLQSYQDEGVLYEYRVGTREPTELTFETYFRRPGDFRFTWITQRTYPKRQHVQILRAVWSNGAGTFTYESNQGTKNAVSLGVAIQARTGVSRGTITTIPGLIIGRDNVIWSVEDAHDLSLLEPSDFEGIRCLRMQGTLRGDTVEIWVGRDDLLIRRIVIHHPPEFLGGKLPMEEEVRRNVRCDPALDDGTFELTPPG